MGQQKLSRNCRLKSSISFFFLDFAIWTVLVFWISIKFNVYELSRDEYSLYGNVSVSFRPPYLCSSEGRQHGRRFAVQLWVTHFSEYLANEKTAQTWILARLFWYPLDSWSNLFISTQVSKLAKKQIKQAEKIQLSMEMTPLLQDNSKDTASTSYHLGDEVWKKSARRAKRFYMTFISTIYGKTA